MARATKGTRVLKRVTKKTVPTVNLELTEGEADFLQAVLCKISGDEEKSPRKYASAIAKALEFATEQKFTQTDAFKLLSRPHSGIHFKNYPGELKAPLAGIEPRVEFPRTGWDRHPVRGRIGVYGDANGVPDGRDIYDEMGYH